MDNCSNRHGPITCVNSQCSGLVVRGFSTNFFNNYMYKYDLFNYRHCNFKVTGNQDTCSAVCHVKDTWVLSWNYNVIYLVKR